MLTADWVLGQGLGGFWMAPSLSGSHFGVTWSPKSGPNPSKIAPEPPLGTKMWTKWHPYGTWSANQVDFGGPKLPRWSPNPPQTTPNGSQIGSKIGQKLIKNR